MTTAEMADKLLTAMNSIREVEDQLDTTKTTCQECGAGRYLHWEQHQWKESLEGAQTRLVRVIGALRSRS